MIVLVIIGIVLFIYIYAVLAIYRLHRHRMMIDIAKNMGLKIYIHEVKNVK